MPAPHQQTPEPQHRDSLGSVGSVHSVNSAAHDQADASSDAGAHDAEHGSSEAASLPPAHYQQPSAASSIGHGSADQSEVRPPHRAWHAACALMDDSLGAEVVVVCGGVSSGASRLEGGLCGDLWAYDPIARAWGNRSPGLNTRPGSRAAAASGAAPSRKGKQQQAAGGAGAARGSSRGKGGPSPLPRAYHTMTAVAGGQAAVLFGGRTPTADRTDDVWVLNANTFSWTSLAKPPPPPMLLSPAQPPQAQASAPASVDPATNDPVEDLGDDDASAAPSITAASVASKAQSHQPLQLRPSSSDPEFVPCPGPGPTVWHAACAATLDSELLAMGYSADELKQLSNLMPNHESSPVAHAHHSGDEEANANPDDDGEAAAEAAAGGDVEGVDDELVGPGESQLKGEPPDDESESGSRAGAEHGLHEEEEAQRSHAALAPLWPVKVNSSEESGDGDERPEVVLIFGGLTSDRTSSAAPTSKPSVDDDGDASVVSTSNTTVVSAASAAAFSQQSSVEPAPPVGYAAPLYALDRFGRWHLVDTTDGQLSTPVGGRAVPGPGPRFGLALVATEGMDSCIVVGGVSTGQPPAYKTSAATTAAAAAAAAGKAALESTGSSYGAAAFPGAGASTTLMMGQQSLDVSYRAGYRHQDAYALNLYAPQPDYAAMGLEDAQARARQNKVKGPQRVNITLPCGSEYDGYVNNKQQPHGEGKLWYGAKDPKNRADDFYEGSFVHGLRSGSGKVVYSDGTSYEGRWVKDLPDGLGTLYRLSPQAAAAAVAQGQGRTVEFHEGSWQKGQRHGSGEAHYADGAVLRATWVQGELLRDPPLGGGGSLIVYDEKTKHKRAVITQLEFGEAGGGSASSSEAVVAGVETLAPAPGGGREVYTGKFNAKGERHADDGECVYADGSSYRGAWRSGARNGKGVFESVTTKERYEGKWVGDFRCGRGLCTYAAGHRYEGQWANGQREGTGTFFRAGGECYSGEWLRGERHGHGVRTDARGRIVKESWKLGELMEEEEPAPETNEDPAALSGQP